MTNYRFVVRHVRYWRGKVHKWSTSYSYQGTRAVTQQDCIDLLNKEDEMLWTDTPSEGGSYECQAYNADSGGMALATYVKFDVNEPSTWPGHNGNAWTHIHGQEPVAEVALIVEWPAGLSSSGKPVRFRKYLHAVQVSQGGAAGVADVTQDDVTSLQVRAAALRAPFQATGLVMASKSGRIAGTPVVHPYYGNHQMPRGRRTVSKKSVNSNLPGIFKILEDEGYSVTKG